MGFFEKLLSTLCLLVVLGFPVSNAYAGFGPDYTVSTTLMADGKFQTTLSVINHEDYKIARYDGDGLGIQKRSSGKWLITVKPNEVPEYHGLMAADDLREYVDGIFVIRTEDGEIVIVPGEDSGTLELYGFDLSR